METAGLWISVASGDQSAAPYVRVAQLEVDSLHLEEFKAALRENGSASVRDETGVLAMHALELKEVANRFLVFEMYKDEAAYSAHRETVHFRKFIDSTREMAISKVFLDVCPIILGAKMNW
jgi:quinol monooxygenase YgiN